MLPNKKSIRIFVDADACPVKNESIKVVDRHQLEIYIVSNGGIKPSQNPLVKLIVVNYGPDEADNWIVSNVYNNDIVITNDVPLAARCLEKDAHVLSYKGELLKKDNIGNKLASRNLMNDIRSANPFYIDKGKPFSKKNRSQYLNQLESLIVTAKNKLDTS